jgi:hypothetical protein
MSLILVDRIYLAEDAIQILPLLFTEVKVSVGKWRPILCTAEQLLFLMECLIHEHFHSVRCFKCKMQLHLHLF